MNLIERETNNFEFLIETLDDLWVLSQFIVQNDRLFATTERKVKIGSETNYKVVKKLIFVELLVKQAKFENETLRVTGEIQNETEFTATGASHTLSFSPGDKIKLYKPSILKFEEKLIDNACKSKNSMNLLILLDKDELIASEFSPFSYRILYEQKGLGSKKYQHTEINEEEQKFKIIENSLKKDYSSIILSGPGIYKDKLLKYIKDKTNQKPISFQFADVSATAIPRAIKKINETGILSESQLAHENKYMSKLLENINKKEKHAYSKQNTFESVNAGSCEILLVSTKFIEQSKDENNYEELNSIMKTVEQLQGELVIVDSKNETGKQLDGLGGIAGILRY